MDFAGMNGLGVDLKHTIISNRQIERQKRGNKKLPEVFLAVGVWGNGTGRKQQTTLSFLIPNNQYSNISYSFKSSKWIKWLKWYYKSDDDICPCKIKTLQQYTFTKLLSSTTGFNTDNNTIISEG